MHFLIAARTRVNFTSCGPSILHLESIKWFLENQAFSPSYDLAPSPPSHPFRQQVVSLYQSSGVSPVQLTEGRGRRGCGRSQIIRWRESLVLYKSFNALWLLPQQMCFDASFQSRSEQTVHQESAALPNISYNYRLKQSNFSTNLVGSVPWIFLYVKYPFWIINPQHVHKY